MRPEGYTSGKYRRPDQTSPFGVGLLGDAALNSSRTMSSNNRHGTFHPLPSMIDHNSLRLPQQTQMPFPQMNAAAAMAAAAAAMATMKSANPQALAAFNKSVHDSALQATRFTHLSNNTNNCITGLSSSNNNAVRINPGISVPGLVPGTSQFSSSVRSSSDMSHRNISHDDRKGSASSKFNPKFHSERRSRSRSACDYGANSHERTHHRRSQEESIDSDYNYESYRSRAPRTQRDDDKSRYEKSRHRDDSRSPSVDCPIDPKAIINWTSSSGSSHGAASSSRDADLKYEERVNAFLHGLGGSRSSRSPPSGARRGRRNRDERSTSSDYHHRSRSRSIDDSPTDNHSVDYKHKSRPRRDSPPPPHWYDDDRSDSSRRLARHSRDYSPRRARRY